MEIKDQLGRVLKLNQVPERIISIVPSQTEFLYDLGLGDKIIAQTIFCVHPADKSKNAVKVGGTKRLHMEKIRELQPDIIIANKEENDQRQIEILEKEFPVWISDIKTLPDALQMMITLGQILDRGKEALYITDRVQQAFNTIQNTASPKRALYLIWREPWMAAGRDTFIHEMLRFAGFDNAIAEVNSRYPELSVSDIQTWLPEVVLLSSEPYPFRQKHLNEIQALCPNAKVVLVDGELFSWYGSRLLKAPEYFRSLRAAL